jgi:hypothetical protein
VLRLRFEYLAALVLRQRPPRGVLADRDQRGPRASGPAEPFLLRDQGVLLGALDVALVADDATQAPDGVAGRRGIAGARGEDAGRLDAEGRCRRQRLADHRPRLLDPPRTRGSAREREQTGDGRCGHARGLSGGRPLKASRA